MKKMFEWIKTKLNIRFVRQRTKVKITVTSKLSIKLIREIYFYLKTIDTCESHKLKAKIWDETRGLF